MPPELLDDPPLDELDEPPPLDELTPPEPLDDEDNPLRPDELDDPPLVVLLASSRLSSSASSLLHAEADHISPEPRTRSAGRTRFIPHTYQVSRDSPS